MVLINGRRFSVDPIHKEHGQWYLWQETWADKSGPFESRKQAEAYLEEYCKVMDKDNEKSMKEPTEEEDIVEIKKIMNECMEVGFIYGFHSGKVEQHKRMSKFVKDHRKKNAKEYWEEQKKEIWRSHGQKNK